MPKSPEALMETETIIRWDELNPVAVLWTASAKVRREWESFGFKPVARCDKDGSGWRTEVPIDRITYKPVKK